MDWYHACEHLWVCGRAVHGEGGAAAWVEPLKTLLWEGEVLGLVQRLHEQRKSIRAPAARDAPQNLMTYLKNQDDRLAYDKFRAAGYDLGSGRVESACKSVQVRAKRPGMQWTTQGLQPVLSLRAQWLSGDWDSFWQTNPLTKAA